MKNKILKKIVDISTVMCFCKIKPDFSNIDEVYNNNLNYWFLNNSDNVTTKDGNSIEIINNEIINAYNVVFSKTKDGFQLNEIDFIKEQIKFLDNLYFDKLSFKQQKQFEAYKSFLLNKQKAPEQTEINKPDEFKNELHNHIFKGNAFEFWQKLFENFNINETKRTDLRFMYEVMKYNGQIHETVTVTNITDWINDTYEFSIEKLQYTNIKSKSNQNRMSIYNLIK